MDSNIANPPLPNGIDLLYWAIQKERFGREANSMASSNPLPSSRVAPVTQSDYLGLTTHPAIELGPPRQKRRLKYVKCDFCRRSKKKVSVVLQYQMRPSLHPFPTVPFSPSLSPLIAQSAPQPIYPSPFCPHTQKVTDNSMRLV
jgi:hypothetical protein